MKPKWGGVCKCSLMVRLTDNTLSYYRKVGYLFIAVCTLTSDLLGIKSVSHPSAIALERTALDPGGCQSFLEQTVGK